MERYEIQTNSFNKLKTIHYDIWFRFEIKDTRFYGSKNGYKLAFFANPDQVEQIKKHITDNYDDVVIDKCKKL